jgi:hypothetical protein
MRRSFFACGWCRAAFLFIFAWVALSAPRFSFAQEVSALASEAAANPAPLVTNAADSDVSAVRGLMARLEAAAAARDATALKLFGVGDTANYSALTVRTRLSHLAVNNAYALVRHSYQVVGSTAGDSPVVIGRGVQDIALLRGVDGGWTLSDKRWAAPADALQVLWSATREEWQGLQDSASGNGRRNASDDVVLHLVAEWRGGRWIALRRSRWNGRVYEASRLAQREGTGSFDVRTWLNTQMARWSQNRPYDAPVGTVHFLMQRGVRGWVGLDSVWEPSLHARDDTAQIAQANRESENWRIQMQGAAFYDLTIRSEFAAALEQAGLHAEAADEYEKIEALQPGAVGVAKLQQVATERLSDPAARAARQLQDEAKVGLVADHPTYMIQALAREQRSQPTPLRSLRLGLEYSKLGDDTRAASWLDYANQLMRQGGWRQTNPNDAGWIEVLHDHLEERRRLAPLKPPNAIRSALFTVRCWSNDPGVLPLLAALETSQHTVYADFRIPMGSTEVVLWRTQSEFQSYTSRFSAQGNSEFVAALTLTKLIATDDGPLVLGEEVNVFIDPRLESNMFSTVAHEYGHVAVRQLSRGRNVPVWFNEGVATAVEGGYDGYLPRVRNAKAGGRLLSMREMQAWDVDGERAFLAYSQANSIVDFMVRTWGSDAVLEILRQIGRDVAPEEAFRKVLGVSSGQLWSRWAKEGIE